MKSILKVIKDLQNHVPDDLVNTIMEYTGDVFEETKITYYEIVIKNVHDIKYIYDINLSNEYPDMPPHRRTRYNYQLNHIFYICECGKICSKRYMVHTHNNHFIPIKPNKLKPLFKRKLKIYNETRIHQLRNINENRLIIEQNNPLRSPRIINPWKFRTALYRIQDIKLRMYKHTINSQRIKIN